MGRHILLVDSTGNLDKVLRQAVAGVDLGLFAVQEIAEAKRSLILHEPHLIVLTDSIGGNSEAGYVFCKELQSHSTLSKVPVLICVKDLTEDCIRKASDSGAKAIVPIGAGDLLRKRIEQLLPGLFGEKATSSQLPKAENKQPPAAGDAKSVAKNTAASQDHAGVAGSNEEGFEAKLKLSQNILAKVLHNLKTSHLLQVVELDDVPRVIVEITRSVCAQQTSELAALRAQKSSSSDDVARMSVELDKLMREK